jgi:coenzyme Q-binding protein COQ10
MTVYTASRILDAPPEAVFDLVADVESYPEFLPMWRDARVIRRRGNVYTTEQEVGIGPIRERFHTRTVLTKSSHIEVTSTDGLFRNFFIRWDFDPAGRGCRISIALSWEVHSHIMQKAIDMVLPETARMMVEAFERRANERLNPAD